MTRTPEEVFQHHVQALGAGDLDEIVADYTDDAVFITRPASSAARTASGPPSPRCSPTCQTRPGT
jgi:hypothetical protein